VTLAPGNQAVQQERARIIRASRQLTHETIDAIQERCARSRQLLGLDSAIGMDKTRDPELQGDVEDVSAL
jgi:hypothetical protein